MTKALQSPAVALWLERGGAALDALFDAAGALARVIARGAFWPDAGSFRSSRFAALTEQDVLVQHVALNAADEGEALRIIRTEPQRYLPFSLDQTHLDVAAVADGVTRPAGAEKPYRLGLFPHDRAKLKRDAIGKDIVIGAEAFVWRGEAGDATRPLIFFDAQGVRQRRLRRALTLVAACALAWSASAAYGAWHGALETRAAASERALAAIEHRIRRATLETKRLQTALALIDGKSKLDMKATLAALERAALRVPDTSGVSEVTASGDALTLSAKSYDPVELELELRRAFEGQRVDFSRAGSRPPEDVSATITLSQGPKS